MARFEVVQVMKTYATIEVEAESMADLRENYDAYLDGRDDWSYETDYDSAESHNITPCTGTTDRIGRFGHDGDTCPIHENVPAVVPGAPMWYSHEAASAWQNGWEAGYEAAFVVVLAAERAKFVPAVVPVCNRYSFVPKENYA